MPRCSIVIPVHDKASLTRQCLNALLRHPPEIAEFEIVVVDDASTDVTQQLLAEYGGKLRVVTHNSNTGFATACNDGANAALGEYLVFLNNDTIPKAGWLDALVRYADAHPAAAVVGSKLIFPNDTIQHAGVVICQDRFPRHLYAGFPADHPATNRSRRFQIVTAASALIRRARFEEARGFDTAFVNGYEDVDLCLRLGEQGHEIHYCHESVLYHLESVSEGRWKHLEDNDKLYRARWRDRVVPDDVQYYLEDGLLEFSYSPLYPFHLSIAPNLGVVGGEEQERRADRMLEARSHQVFDLLKENIRLGVRLQEVESSKLLGFSNGPAPVASSAGSTPLTEPRLLFRGQVHSPTNKRDARLISIILPTKNGAPQLRQSLPRILSQNCRDNFEIIAVDSGSKDDSVAVLREHQATVVSIDPRSFNHGTTRNLAASYAKGGIFVFMNQSAIPADDRWLANLVEPLYDDPKIAGVCSRVLPRPDADLLTTKDGMRDPSGSPERATRSIKSLTDYQNLAHHQLRLLINFHTVSAAIRPQVLARIPFREVTVMGEDILWAKEVLEAGFTIQHEPSSTVLHSHEYSLLEVLQRNFDDGVANREIVGRRLDDTEVVPTIFSLVRNDWRYLEDDCHLDAQDLDHWRQVSVLRRTAQIVGQWAGGNLDTTRGDLMPLLSLTARIKLGSTFLDGRRGVE